MNDVRLLYVSKFKDERYSTSELYNILTEALEFNELHKIYGALYFGNNYFVQCLEGMPMSIMISLSSLSRIIMMDLILISWNQTLFLLL